MDQSKPQQAPNESTNFRQDSTRHWVVDVVEGAVRILLCLTGMATALYPAMYFPVAEVGITNRPPLPIPYAWSVLLGRRMLPFLALLLCVAFLRTIPSRHRRDTGRTPQRMLTWFLLLTVAWILTFYPGKNIDLCAHLALRCLGSIFILIALGERLWTGGSVLLEKVLRRLIFKSHPIVYLGVLSVCFFFGALVFCGLVLGFLPHVADSMSLLWQGKIFASGRLSIPALPREIQPFFIFFYAISGESLYSIYPPGQPLLFAVGFLLNAPFLVAPTLGAGTLIGIYLVAKEIADDATGRLAALLAAFSPFLLFMSGSFIAHTGTLFFNSFGVYFFLRLIKSETPLPSVEKGARLSWFVDGLACGACFGMAFLCRPYTTAALAPVAVPVALWYLIRSHWRKITGFCLAALVSGALLALFLLYNQMTTGDPLTTGYQVGSAMENFTLEWSPIHGVQNTATNFAALHLLLFAFPFPSLFAVWWLLYSRRTSTLDILMLLMGFAPVIAYFFYSFQDLCYGPRFFYTSSLFFIVLSARGIIILKSELSDDSRGVHPFIPVLLLAFYVTTIARIAPDMEGYWQASPEKTAREVKSAGVTQGIILVNRWDRLPVTLNSVSFNSDIIYALNRGKRNIFLLHWYPSYDIYHLHHDILKPVRILKQADPGERLHNQLLHVKLTEPVVSYERVDRELDEAMMNRLVFQEKTPFLWSDMVLNASEEIFTLDVWGRVYEWTPDGTKMLNPCPFKDISQPLLAMGLCISPDGRAFILLDQRGGLYRVTLDRAQPKVLHPPSLTTLTVQVECGTDDSLVVLCEDGSLLQWTAGGGYSTIEESPGTENVEYRMCVFDEGKGFMVMDSRGALYPYGSAKDIEQISLTETWDWEAARAIRVLDRRMGTFVTMDAFGATAIRGVPNPRRLPYTDGLPYNTSWEYAVDIEVSRDCRTLYLLNRNGEVWKSSASGRK